MPVSKQPLSLNFAQGLDTKTDPFQIQAGKFLSLSNSVFTKGSMLQKRNGYGRLPTLPDSSALYCTTFNGDLTAIGNSFEAYSNSTKVWTNKGSVTPLSLTTLPLLRNNLNQSQADTAVAPNGLVCTVYTETSGGTNTYKYVIADSTTGLNIIPPTAITGADATLGTPRVFVITNHFIIIYTNKVSTTYHLKFFAVSTGNPSNVTAPADISTSYTPSATLSFDAALLNSTLYIAWSAASGAGINMAYIASNLLVSSSFLVDNAHVATIMSVCADTHNQVIWASYFNSGSSTSECIAVDVNLNVIGGFPTSLNTSGTLLNIASTAQNGILTVLYETSHTSTSIQTNFVSSVTVPQATGSAGPPVVVARSVGLASKGFIIAGVMYALVAYSSTYQPTYFLMNAAGKIVAKIAYSNGGGYLATGLPSVTVTGSTAQVAYLFKDLIAAVNKNTNVAAGNQTAGIYSQTGINLVSFTFGASGLVTSEIGANLNITGGFLWAYDGYLPVEQNFFLYPDSIQNTATATTGGHLAAQIYYSQWCYEWTDNQGNAFRSAPSVPVIADISGSGTATNTLTWVVPTLRLTYKTANPVKIVGYRWSTAQQVYYQFTSITSPVLNDPTVDSVTVVDTLSDATILGNNILYTNGGVVEDTGAPSSSATTLFDDRLWLVSAEDRNLLWFSKQVIESTPVEMSDLLTMYVAPSVGATGPTGPISALSTMDDKLIIFKSRASYYVNGSGPDNTGANNQYSQPIFITSMVGCSNQRSVVLQPQGLMFEFASEAGNQIWLLGRDLSTKYIGADVEGLTKNATIVSSIAVPGTNQVRFNLSSGITLMYDYYYGQWGTFSTNAASSTLFQGLHTYVDPHGAVFQETPGFYLDGSTPVLLSLTTGWINLAGLQGFERFYSLYLLGSYISPFKLGVGIAYDYNSSLQELTSVTPEVAGPVFGGDTLYGGGNPYGGASNIFKARVYPSKQKCSSFQVSLSEVYDSTLGVVAGAGLTLSGMNLIVGIKKGSRNSSAARNFG